MREIAEQLKALMTAEPPHLWTIIGASNAPLARRIAAALWVQGAVSDDVADLMSDINAKYMPGDVDFFVNQRQEKRNRKIMNGEESASDET